MLLKIGSNSKLGKSIASFNLPAISTCPGRTSFCENLCYADKGFFSMPSIKKAYATAKDEADSDTFADKINGELKSKPSIKAVRIHASGDFYSTEYLAKWTAIAAANPDVRFWAYTRCWRLQDFHDPLAAFAALPNVQLFASLDQETKASETPPSWMRTADLVPKWDQTPQDTVECPNQKNKDITCEKCTYCFKPEGQRKRNVVFAAH